jgi:hypothetical protein
MFYGYTPARRGGALSVSKLSRFLQSIAIDCINLFLQRLFGWYIDLSQFLWRNFGLMLGRQMVDSRGNP